MRTEVDAERDRATWASVSDRHDDEEPLTPISPYSAVGAWEGRVNSKPCSWKGEEATLLLFSQGVSIVVDWTASIRRWLLAFSETALHATITYF